MGVLDALGTSPFDRPGRDRTKLRSPAEVMAASPQVTVIIESREPYDSGKEKTHTLKAQVVVDPRGRVETVSGSVPGSPRRAAAARLGRPGAAGRGRGGDVGQGLCGCEGHLPGRAGRDPVRGESGSSVVGHTMAQLNRFTVLRQVFRGQKRERHGEVVRVVPKLVNRRVEVKPLKTYAA